MNVVFDTNVYLNLIKDLDCQGLLQRAYSIRRQEALHHIRAFAYPTVMLELLAHLSDTTDPKYRESVRAIAMLNIHCQQMNGECHLAMVAPSEAHLCQTLFGRVPAHYEELTHVIGSICEQVSKGYLCMQDEVAACQACDPRHLDLMHSWVTDLEQHFKDSFKLSISTVDSKRSQTQITFDDDNDRVQYLKYLRSEKALRLFASGWVLKALDTMDITPTVEDAKRYIGTVAREFRASLEIYREIWFRIATMGYDFDHPKKGSARVNSLWDMDIASVAGSDKVIDNEPIVLITTDGMIYDAFGDAGYPQSAMKRVQYLEHIGLKL